MKRIILSAAAVGMALGLLVAHWLVGFPDYPKRPAATTSAKEMWWDLQPDLHYEPETRMIYVKDDSLGQYQYRIYRVSPP